MAHIDCSFYSECLLKNVHVVVYIPSVSPDDVLEERPVDYDDPGKLYPTLYLLHGMYGDCMDWPLKSGIEQYAQDKGIAVVMPSAENSYYTNMPGGDRYLDYVGRELPAFMTKMFPLSRSREDTYIAGLSMGGYGAFRIGLAFPERFGYIASLSGALLPGKFLDVDAPHVNHLPASYKRALMEGSATFNGTENDLLYLAEKRKAQLAPEAFPKMYMTVGTEDFIYPLNELFYAGLQELGLDVVYEKYPGEHCWAFWDAHIQDVLRWLPERKY